MIERTVAQWLELIEQGPHEENECRGCFRPMTPMPESSTEPTSLCHSCAQLFLPLLIEEHTKVRTSARTGWNTAHSLAVMYSARASEKAADKALKELGDA